MNGVHDIGGMHGFGPVDRDEAVPVRLERWEGASIALVNLVVGSIGNIDEFRHSIERMAPAHYLSSTYYEHWVDGVLRIFEERGELDPGQFEAKLAEYIANPADVADVPVRPGPLRPRKTRSEGHPFRRPGPEPRYEVGDAVTARNINPAGHTRLARYIRGKAGRIHACHGAFIFPDSNAHALGEDPQPLYSVRFEAADVWGEDAGAREAIYIDLWESYLLPG